MQLQKRNLPHCEGHCAVQINYCEAALLGGVTNDTEFRDDILIFNFDDAKWKVGPRYIHT